MTTDLHHLAGPYVLDALDLDERDAFETHYPHCEICSADVATDREVVVALAEAVAVAPRPELKASIMAEVTRTRQIPPVVPDRVVDLAERRRRRLPARAGWLATAAAAVVAIIAAASVFTLNRNLSGTSEIDDLVAASDAVVTPLDGADDSVRVVWSAERGQAAVFANDLDDPGAGQAYALWRVQGDGNVAFAGVFTPDNDGAVRAIIAIDDETNGENINDEINDGGADVAGWGITIEPETGSEQPTSEILYLGEL